MTTHIVTYAVTVILKRSFEVPEGQDPEEVAKDLRHDNELTLGTDTQDPTVIYIPDGSIVDEMYDDDAYWNVEPLESEPVPS
jgi:hypothetical protein